MSLLLFLLAHHTNPGPLTCKANALPLSYIPFSQQLLWSFIITIVRTHINYSHIFHNAGVTRLYYDFLVAHQTCFKSIGEAGF